jgi:hypothetical protein
MTLGTESMKVKTPRKVTILCSVCLIFALVAPAAWAQTSSATATPVNTSTGRPSTLQIRQNIVARERAAIQRGITEVQRCLNDATRAQTLRDPQGNINQVPKIDIVNCGRRLAILQDRIRSLSRRSAALTQDAQAQALALRRKLQATQTKLRLQGLSAQ